MRDSKERARGRTEKDGEEGRAGGGNRGIFCEVDRDGNTSHAYISSAYCASDSTLLSDSATSGMYNINNHLMTDSILINHSHDAMTSKSTIMTGLLTHLLVKHVSNQWPKHYPDYPQAAAVLPLRYSLSQVWILSHFLPLGFQMEAPCMP